MNVTTQPIGAQAALLDEYRKAIEELISVIESLPDEQLLHEFDPDSKDPDTKSIQTILTHVVSSMFSYSVYIENHIGIATERPERLSFQTINPYIESLRQGFEYSYRLFANNPDLKLEELNNEKKIHTRWGQHYDIEQLMEHAIVHILRHRRQIERQLKPRVAKNA